MINENHTSQTLSIFFQINQLIKEDKICWRIFPQCIQFYPYNNDTFYNFLFNIT